MAEDGMLVNFDIGDAPFISQPKFRGGSWKDRLSAKKSALWNRQKSNRVESDSKDDLSHGPKSTPNIAVNVDIDTRPVKRPRIDHESRSIESIHRVRPRGSNASGNQSRPEDGKPRQVVSSLFTYNPKALTVEEETVEPSIPAKPSNAPLRSELDTFTSLGLSSALAEHLFAKMSIKAPTAIQRATVTQLLKEDTDAFIQAETGSGKTLAYLLPIVERLMRTASKSDGDIQRNSGLFAIVLAPTRELSKQIAVVLESLLRCAHWIVSGIVIGGEKKKSEKARLRKGLNILIATPGRLADHIDNTEALDVSNVRWVVLDEGDRLMELGFEKDISKILERLEGRSRKRRTIPGLPDRRITMLCSATMKSDVQKLGEISLKDAVHVYAVETDADAGKAIPKKEVFLAPAQLKQSYMIVPAKLRLVTLTAVLKRAFARRGSVMKAIAFHSCADSVDFHFEVFARATAEEEQEQEPQNKPPTIDGNTRTNATATIIGSKDNPVQIFRLHGSLPQAIRTSTLAAFRATTKPSLLICTDVVSRGIDLPNIDLVIEYDPAFNKDDHLHRIGRTARAGKDGRALCFLLPGNEEGYVEILKEGRQDEGKGVTRNDTDEVLRKGFGSTGIGAGKDWEEKATEWQLNLERWALENPNYLEQARRAYQSHIRAYATHIAAERSVFDITTLHLGHLAKAYGLRDRPGSIKVPGSRPSTKGAKADRSANARKRSSNPAGSEVQEASGPTLEAARKMRAKFKEQSGASEFNLG